MESEPFFLPLIIFSSIALGLPLLWMVRGVTFTTPGTDNEKVVRAAAHSTKWRWPSDMHKYGQGKCWMKDVHTLQTALAQRILRDRHGEFPLVFHCIISQVFSGILVFQIATQYWNTAVGLIVFCLYILSLWPYQYAIWGHPAITAQFWFLLSVFFVQRAEQAASFEIYALAGCSMTMTLFSSGLARKYVLLIVAALLHSAIQWSDALKRELGAAADYSAFLIAASILGVAVCLVLFSYKTIFRLVYEEKLPKWFPIGSGDGFKQDICYYFTKLEPLVNYLTKIAAGVAVYILLYGLVCSFSQFFHMHLFFFFGCLMTAMFFLLPDIVSNIRGYIGYATFPRYFRFITSGYFDYYERIGKPLSPKALDRDRMRWYYRFFFRIIPFHFLIYLAALTVCILLVFCGGIALRTTLEMCIVVALSLWPIIYGEITRCSLESRLYFPVFPSLLLLVGYTFSFFDPGLILHKFGLWITCCLCVIGGWNLWLFITDVWPARMTGSWLARELGRLGIKEFYTYDTFYNDNFLKAMPASYLNDCTVHYIKTLADIEDGYVLVPGGSDKSLAVEARPRAELGRDFDDDPELNRLLASREIEKLAVKSFETIGTSKIWILEGPVTSYRDLVLGEVTDKDRWRARGWILDMKKRRTSRPVDAKSSRL